jgi:hypothetical protein
MSLKVGRYSSSNYAFAVIQAIGETVKKRASYFLWIDQIGPVENVTEQRHRLEMLLVSLRVVKFADAAYLPTIASANDRDAAVTITSFA